METTAEEQEGLVTEFMRKADQFSQMYSYLSAQLSKVQGSPLEPELRKLLVEGEEKRSTMDTIKMRLDSALEGATGVWDSITDWFSEMTGSAPQANGVGLLPLLLGAGLVSSVAGGTYALDGWLARGQTMTHKIDTFESLKDQGYNTTEAAVLANKFLSDQASKGTLDKMLILAGIGLAGLFLWKFK